MSDRIQVMALLPHLRHNPHGVAINGRVYSVDIESGMLYLPGEKYGVLPEDAAELRGFEKSYRVYAPKAPPPPVRRASASGGSAASAAPDSPADEAGPPDAFDAEPTGAPEEAEEEEEDLGAASAAAARQALREELESVSVYQLKKLAKEAKVAGYTRMEREDLIEALLTRA